MSTMPYRRTGKRDGIDWDYILTEDVEIWLPAKALPWMPPRTFGNDWMDITPAAGSGEALLALREGYACDGCTGVPDAAGTILAAFAHDAVYQFSGELSHAWKRSIPSVLIWGDYAFRAIMRRDGANPVIRETYYIGVRLFGVPFRYLSRWFG
jgi:hypothetical protein